MSNRQRKASRTKTSTDPQRSRALLQTWLSPSFPIGAFAYSHGLEKAVENGWLRGRAELEAWLADLLAHGALHNDLVLLTLAWRATREACSPTLAEVAELAVALQPSAERLLEATQQGQSFIGQIEQAWPADREPFAEVAAGMPPTLAVAIGYAAACHDVPLEDTLAAYAVAFAANLASAAIRLGVIGQTDGQRNMAALLDRLLAAAAAAVTANLDSLGTASWRSDIASLQHETQYTRLFRS